MRRPNHTEVGEPKVTPFGVNIYGILSKDAQRVKIKLSEVRFPETPYCLGYLSAKQKWIYWWIRIILKYVSEAIVQGIAAGIVHRARLAHDLAMSPHNALKSPSRVPQIQIADKIWRITDGQVYNGKAAVTKNRLHRSASGANTGFN